MKLFIAIISLALLVPFVVSADENLMSVEITFDEPFSTQAEVNSYMEPFLNTLNPESASFVGYGVRTFDEILKQYYIKPYAQVPEGREISSLYFYMAKEVYDQYIDFAISKGADSPLGPSYTSTGRPRHMRDCDSQESLQAIYEYINATNRSFLEHETSSSIGHPDGDTFLSHFRNKAREQVTFYIMCTTGSIFHSEDWNIKGGYGLWAAFERTDREEVPIFIRHQRAVPTREEAVDQLRDAGMQIQSDHNLDALGTFLIRGTATKSALERISELEWVDVINYNAPVYGFDSEVTLKPVLNSTNETEQIAGIEEVPETEEDTAIDRVEEKITPEAAPGIIDTEPEESQPVNNPSFIDRILGWFLSLFN